MMKTSRLSQEEAIRRAADREQDFVDKVMPAIRGRVVNRFGRRTREEREEIAQTMYVLAWQNFIRTMQAGLEPLDYVGAIVQHATMNYVQGDRGNGRESRDGRSLRARMPGVSTFTGCEYLHEVKRHDVPVADQVAFNIDFTEWRAMHEEFQRSIIDLLATGHMPVQVMNAKGLTKHQFGWQRTLLHRAWQRFQGEQDEAA